MMDVNAFKSIVAFISVCVMPCSFEKKGKILFIHICIHDIMIEAATTKTMKTRLNKSKIDAWHKKVQKFRHPPPLSPSSFVSISDQITRCLRIKYA